MAYSICKIKNISGAQHTIKGQLFEIDEIITIQDEDRIDWASDDVVGTDITDDKINVCDGTGCISGYMAQIAHLQDY